MHRLLNVSQQQIADTGAITSGGIWTIAWLANFNEVLQTIALLIAIISGGISIYYHLKKDK